MADAEDKEKAEKLAAAKKRFEQLKKQKEKGKKGTAKKKDEKTEESESKLNDETANQDGPNGEEAKDDAAEKVEDKAGEERPSSPSRTPSLTLQSRQRSESFRKGSTTSGALKSPTLETVDAEDEAEDTPQKQATTIEELRKELARLKDADAKRIKAEEELEQLKEDDEGVGALKVKAALADEKAAELEKLKSELSATQRQLNQAQQLAHNRRKSSAGVPNDLTHQLASKTSTIESLELELSNLKYQNNIYESDKSALEISTKQLEQRANAAEAKVSALQSELDQLKDSMTSPAASDAKSGDVDSAALQRQISVLESSLRTAETALATTANRANNLEGKVETLTKLHRESSTQNAAREKEVKDLKSRIKSLSQARTDAAGEDLSDLEDEEREKLNGRIRDLEAENFELRRGVWRDKRMALQPGMDDEDLASPGYESVDLNGSGSNPYAARPGIVSGVRQSSTFSDVLQSGISAFTGRENPRTTIAGRNGSEGASVIGRKASLGLLSEDGFDEDSFRLAQEEEAKARIERVKEVKRGLEQWRGWRLDLVEQRQAGLPGFVTGPIFEV